MDSPDKSGLARGPGSMRRRSVVPNEIVSIEPFREGQALPYVVRPSIKGIDTITWLRSNRKWIESKLDRHGALLFRDFQVSTPEGFRAFADAVLDKLIDYRERSSPRKAVHQQVYTSTDHPASETIFLHNEHSYAQTWPQYLLFYCHAPAQQGGQTPLADCRRVLANIPQDVQNQFATRKWMYVRNLGSGWGLSWQDVYQTEDRSEVEAYCRRNAIDYCWLDKDRLRTKQVREATLPHPRTGETVWFNHATFFHSSTLAPYIRSVLEKEFSEEDLPNHTYFGDGGPIDESVMDVLRSAYMQEETLFEWRAGDVLIIDNMLVAHARQAYVPPRQVLCIMGSPMSRSHARDIPSRPDSQQ